MKKWLIGISALTLITAVVISWQAYRCETARQECQPGQSTYPFSDSIITVPGANDGNENQHDAPNETKGACAQADCYLCKVLIPANMPAIYLVLVGIPTLVVIGWQAWESRKTASIAAETLRMMVNKERSHIFVHPASVSLDRPVPDRPCVHSLTLRVSCKGQAPITRALWKTALNASVDPPNEKPLFDLCGLPNTMKDGDSYYVHVYPPRGHSTLNFSDLDGLEDGRLFLHVWGIVSYDDGLGNDRKTPFGFAWGKPPGANTVRWFGVPRPERPT
jgi:hypothetical protein